MINLVKQFIRWMFYAACGFLTIRLFIDIIRYPQSYLFIIIPFVTLGLILLVLWAFED